MKILLDMNMSPRLVALLDDAGFPTTHWSQVGPPAADDIEIMAFARQNDFVVLTHDLDFGDVLAATNGDKPSVVLLRVTDVSPELVKGAIVTGLRRCQEELEQGALLTIDIERQRLRLLPLNVRT